VSKAIVSTAQGTQRGRALEDLKGIRELSRAGKTGAKRQRGVLHTWGGAQLRAFIAYKARVAGVRVVLVDPHTPAKPVATAGSVSERIGSLKRASFAGRVGSPPTPT